MATADSELLEFYSLREDPFAAGLQRRNAFFDDNRRTALAALYLGIISDRSPLVLVSGPGLGKTVLLHQLRRQLGAEADVALITEAVRNPQDLWGHALRAFRLPAAGDDPVEMRALLCRFVADGRAARRRSVLIVDDAHLLSTEVLQGIDVLSHPGVAPGNSLQFVLSGRPELTQTLKAPALETLANRATHVPALKPLSSVDTERYLQASLRNAGFDRKRGLFTLQAAMRMAIATEGVPARIDEVCSRALALGYAARMTCLGLPIIDSAVAQSAPEPSEVTLAPAAWTEHQDVAPAPVLEWPSRDQSSSAAASSAPEARWQLHPVIEEAIRPREQAPSPSLSGLVQSLLAVRRGSAPRDVLFLSVDQGAQSAQLCADVAKALATTADRRVLVVDADRSQPSLHKHFGLRASPGLAEVLDGSLPIDSATIPLGPQLTILTAGLSPRVAPPLPGQIADLMNRLRSRFDYVLVNGAPFESNDDGLVFGRSAEGVLMVVAAHATRRAAARQAGEALRNAGALLLGAVLTNRTFPIPEAIYRWL